MTTSKPCVDPALAFKNNQSNGDKFRRKEGDRSFVRSSKANGSFRRSEDDRCDRDFQAGAGTVDGKQSWSQGCPDGTAFCPVGVCATTTRTILTNEEAQVSRQQRDCTSSSSAAMNAYIAAEDEGGDFALALALQKEEQRSEMELSRVERQEAEDAELALVLSRTAHAGDVVAGKVVHEDGEASFGLFQDSEIEKVPCPQKLQRWQAQSQEELDQALALTIQSTLHQQDMLLEEQRMVETCQGKAWKFVERVLAMHAAMSREVDQGGQVLGIDTVAVDDMVSTAERMLLQQREFQRLNKPAAVDIGYHYTNSKNLDRIGTEGLLSRAERGRANIRPTTYNGSAYGDGIYTASNPYAFHGTYGDGGLLVARLRGVCLDPFRNGLLRPAGAPSAIVSAAGGQRQRIAAVPVRFASDRGEDSCIVDTGTGDESVVLRRSGQCMPLIRFRADIIRPDTDSDLRPHPGNAVIYSYHVKLQALINNFFNAGEATPVTATSPDPGTVLPPAHAMTARRLALALAAATTCGNSQNSNTSSSNSSDPNHNQNKTDSSSSSSTTTTTTTTTITTITTTTRSNSNSNCNCNCSSSNSSSSSTTTTTTNLRSHSSNKDSSNSSNNSSSNRNRNCNRNRNSAKNATTRHAMANQPCNTPTLTTDVPKQKQPPRQSPRQQTTAATQQMRDSASPFPALRDRWRRLRSWLPRCAKGVSILCVTCLHRLPDRYQGGDVADVARGA